MGVRDTGSLFHSQAPIYMADGGDVEEARMKQRGLDESNKEKPTGFFQRIREGNIDDPKSEAYKKYGAGRARMDDQLDAEARGADEERAAAAPKSASQSPKTASGMDESDRLKESAANYKAVEITPIRQSAPIVSRPIAEPAPASKKNNTIPQERRSEIRFNDVSMGGASKSLADTEAIGARRKVLADKRAEMEKARDEIQPYRRKLVQENKDRKNARKSVYEVSRAFGSVPGFVGGISKVISTPFKDKE
jgi:hypothetical protein